MVAPNRSGDEEFAAGNLPKMPDSLNADEQFFWTYFPAGITADDGNRPLYATMLAAAEAWLARVERVRVEVTRMEKYDKDGRHGYRFALFVPCKCESLACDGWKSAAMVVCLKPEYLDQSTRANRAELALQIMARAAKNIAPPTVANPLASLFGS